MFHGVFGGKERRGHVVQAVFDLDLEVRIGEQGLHQVTFDIGGAGEKAAAGLVLAIGAVTAYSYTIFVPASIVVAITSWAPRLGWKPALATGGWLAGVSVMLLGVLPTVLIQMVMAYVFFDRHWDNVVRHMAGALAGEAALIVHQLDIMRKHRRLIGVEPTPVFFRISGWSGTIQSHPGSNPRR